MPNTTLRQKLETIADNADKLRQLVNEVNSYDDSLDEYRWEEFDDFFFDTFFPDKPEEAARAVFFGDIKNWMDDYIRFNGYGNLESANSYQVDQELIEGSRWIFDRVVEMVDDEDLELETIEGIIEQ